jgi:hypothetical protein
LPLSSSSKIATLDDRKGIAFPCFHHRRPKRTAPHRDLENGESEMMLLEPILRIIDRGYVLSF